MTNPMQCEQCGGRLESDDAISIIEGVCIACRTGQRQAVPVKTADSTTALIEQILSDKVVESGASDHLRAATEDFFQTLIRSETKVESNELAVKAMPVEAVLSPDRKHRARRRDLLGGVASGMIILSLGIAYVLTRPTTSRDPAATPPRASIFVNVEPSTAKVYLNGEELLRPESAGPIELSLKTGDTAPHWIEAIADGYHGYRQPIDPHGPRDVSINLIRKPYELAVETEPAGAEVWINQELKGFTPLAMSVEPSLRGTLTVRKAGHREQRVEIAPPAQGQQLDVKLALQAMGPTLHVESDPPGARVTVAGKDHGVAPLDIELDPSMAGTTVTVVGQLADYVDGAAQASIPVEIGDPIPIRLAMRPAGIPVVIDSDPPGATVVIDNKTVGQAPVAMRFPQQDVGKLIRIQALVPGRAFGEQPIVLPETIEPLKIRVATVKFANRVAFIALRPDSAGPAWSLLADAMAEEIHHLDSTQEFAIVFNGSLGVDAWPDSTSTARASSEQKVRAYDAVRLLRPAASADLQGLVDAALRLEPDAVWLFATAPVAQADLERIEDLLDARSIPISIVCTSPSSDPEWAEQWTLARRGLFTLLGRPETPILAGDTAAEEP